MLAAKVGLTNISEIHLWRTCNWDGSIHFAANRSHLFRFGNPSSPSEMPHCKPAPSNKRKDGDASERGSAYETTLSDYDQQIPTIAPTSPAFWSGSYQPMACPRYVATNAPTMPRIVVSMKPWGSLSPV